METPNDAHGGKESSEKDFSGPAASEDTQSIQTNRTLPNTPTLPGRLPETSGQPAPRRREFQGRPNIVGPVRPAIPIITRQHASPTRLSPSGSPTRAASSRETSNVQGGSPDTTEVHNDDGTLQQHENSPSNVVATSGTIGTQDDLPETSAPEAPENVTPDRGGEAATYLRDNSATEEETTPVFQPSPSQGSRPMKHLTCYFWKVVGNCKYSEATCLYAHRDTGHIANAPILVEPGHSIAGGNLQNYLNNQPAFFTDHRGAQGLNRQQKREFFIARRNDPIPPAIQQQINNIRGRAQQQQSVSSPDVFDDYNVRVSNQFNPQFYHLIPHTMTGDAGSPPVPFPGGFTPTPNTMISPEQQPAGPFSPAPPTLATYQPMGSPSPYTLPAPPSAPTTTNHAHCNNRIEELQSKVAALEADNERLRKGNTTLTKHILGALYMGQRNAVSFMDVVTKDGVKLVDLAKRLYTPELSKKYRQLIRDLDMALIGGRPGALSSDPQLEAVVRGVLKLGPDEPIRLADHVDKMTDMLEELVVSSFVHKEISDASHTSLDVGKSLIDKFDLYAKYLREAKDAMKLVRDAVVATGDEGLLALWDAQQAGIWPHEDAQRR